MFVPSPLLSLLHQLGVPDISFFTLTWPAKHSPNQGWEPTCRLHLYPYDWCILFSKHRTPGGRFNIKMSSYQYRDPHVNSSPPSAAYMRQWNGSSLVQVKACRLIGAKPLPEPMMDYCQMDSWEHISVKFESEFCHFHSRKCNSKMSSA